MLIKTFSRGFDFTIWTFGQHSIAIKKEAFYLYYNKYLIKIDIYKQQKMLEKIL
ncbi:MAG: hypothetical protein LBU74_06175 [Methanobacteriaceae archaeon]|nr:hypothetical protein [Candidatus Methanorudis spinitermitis]